MIMQHQTVTYASRVATRGYKDYSNQLYVL